MEDVDLATESYSDSQINESFFYNRYQWPNEVFERFCPAAVQIDRYISPIWYIIGLFTNPASAIVWTGRRLRRNNSSAIYLAVLSVSDFAFLLLHFVMELQLAWGYTTINRHGLCAFFNFIYMIPQYAAPLLVLGFTVERYIAVCHPFFKEIYCTVRRAVYTVIGLMVLTVLLAVFQIYLWAYDPKSQQCVSRNHTSGEKSFNLIWTWITEMIIFGAVPLAVLMFNILVIKEIRKITKSGTNQLPQQSGSGNNAASTITLISVSFYLIFTTLPVTLVYAVQYAVPLGDFKLSDEEIRQDPTWNKYFTFTTVRRLLEELCFSHYACYFFIYCLTGPQFRKAFANHFTVQRCFKIHDESGKRYKIVSGNGRISNESCTTYV